MRHARTEALDELEGLLATLRTLDGLREKNRGVFYRRSQAFLHFHEDPAGLYADTRLSGSGFERFRVTTAAEQATFVRRVRAALGA